MDVLRNDFSYLEGRTGLDLLTPLEAVAEAHDEVRCACLCMLCEMLAGAACQLQQPDTTVVWRDIAASTAGL
jgi:hypothetical protein